MPRKLTMGKRLEAARKKLGMSRKQVQDRIKDDFGIEIGETTIRAAETGQAPNPGIKTIEVIAKALHLPPLETIALHLDEQESTDPQAFTQSRFGQLYRIYSQMDPARQAWYDEYIDMLLDKMRKG